MLSRAFYERILLLIIGSYIGYYVTVSVAKELSNMDLEYGELPLKYKQMKLTNHEKYLISSIINDKDINVSFDDIQGMDSVIAQFNKLIINPMNNFKQYKETELLHPPNGIILYGPPGTGKTMLAKALCKHMRYNFITFDNNKIEQKLFGESSKVICALFTLAEKIKPCVIFIDEIDGFLSSRNEYDQSCVNGVKTQMLSLMDGISKRDPTIIIIGATNRINSIDKAVKRRMRTHIKIELPTHNSRMEMFKKHLGKYSDCINYNDVATKTNGMSGSDIYEICKNAALNSITTKNKILITNNQLNESIKVFKNN